MTSKTAVKLTSYKYFWRIVFTSIHHFWDFTVRRGGSGAAGRRSGSMQLGAHTACARYIIERTLAVRNFFTNGLFSNKICRAAWMKDLYNILKFFFPAAIPSKVKSKLNAVLHRVETSRKRCPRSVGWLIITGLIFTN